MASPRQVTLDLCKNSGEQEQDSVICYRGSDAVMFSDDSQILAIVTMFWTSKSRHNRFCLHFTNTRQSRFQGYSAVLLFPTGIQTHYLQGNYFVVYTSLVRKGTAFRESISVSTNSSPDRLGYRLLKFASQSSLGLTASPARARSFTVFPENPIP